MISLFKKQSSHVALDANAHAASVRLNFVLVLGAQVAVRRALANGRRRTTLGIGNLHMRSPWLLAYQKASERA